jgi:hypothetical protein
MSLHDFKIVHKDQEPKQARLGFSPLRHSATAALRSVFEDEQEDEREDEHEEESDEEGHGSGKSHAVAGPPSAGPMQSRCNALPHPDPLPKEREKLLQHCKRSAIR